MPVPSSLEYPEVFAHFGIAVPPSDSCYPYAPVFVCHSGTSTVVIKRTRTTPESATAIAAWTAELAGAGVPVVSPVDLPVENPVLIGEVHWVAYPFVDGVVYRGLPEQVTSAGELLGRLHSTPVRVAAPAFEWPEPPDAESVAEDREGLDKVLSGRSPQSARRLGDLVAAFPTQVLPTIRDAGLPTVNAVMDYKANNLIYTPAGPVLVDPDNGDHAPRILDLALAALQFHIEHTSAPARLFTGEQWNFFVSGYLRHVELTEQERSLWPTALQYMLSEFCVWSLIESDDWDDPREAAFMRDLASATPDRFPLP